MKRLFFLTTVMLCVLVNFVIYSVDVGIVLAISDSNAGIESPDSNVEIVTDGEKNKKEFPPLVKDEETITKDKEVVEENTEQANSAFNNHIILILIAVIVVLTILLIFLLIKVRIKNKSTLDNNVNNIMRLEINRRLVPNDNPVFRVGNFQNIGQREEQQDSFCLSDINDKKCLRNKGIMAVVADGMGGLEGGAVISRLVVDTFIKNYEKMIEIDPVKFLHDTAENTEQIVCDYKKHKGINGGSTVVAVIVKADKLYTLSIGDSRIYLLRDDKLEQLNLEHTFGKYLKEKARNNEVDKIEPYINPKRDALTAYIGMGSFLKVDERQHIQLLPGDKILLCSDGVFNTLSDEAMIATLDSDALTAAEKMEQVILAQDIPTQDNFTGIILEYVK